MTNFKDQVETISVSQVYQKVSLDFLSPHPVAHATYRPKNLKKLMKSMESLGQLLPLTVIKGENDTFYIVDGISRFIAAQKLEFKFLKIRIIDDVPENEVPFYRNQINSKIKRTLQEQMEMVEQVLVNEIGSQQGKKRNLEEYFDIYDVEPKKYIDRFELATMICDIDLSPSSLRKMYKIYEAEKNGGDEVKNLKLIDKISEGVLSIDSAVRLLDNFIETKLEQQKPNVISEVQNYNGEVSYKLYNKSCEDLSEIVDHSVAMVVTSPPYYQQRKYPEGNVLSDLRLGEEKNPEDYVKNSVEIFSKLKRVLKKDGNLFINLSDSFSEGVSQIIIPRLIVEMINDGWYLVQEIIWEKPNSKPLGENIKRLRPSTEKILHFCLDRKNRFYKTFKIWDSEDPIKITRGCSDRISLDQEKKSKFSIDKNCISFRDYLIHQKVVGVISGNVVNKTKLKKLSNYEHLAPAPEYLSAIPLFTTTRPGDIVLDIFTGTSGLLELPLKFKRNVIGYDTDPKSIIVSEKRLSKVLNGEQIDSDEIKQLELDFFNTAA